MMLGLLVKVALHVRKASPVLLGAFNDPYGHVRSKNI